MNFFERIFKRDLKSLYFIENFNIILKQMKERDILTPTGDFYKISTIKNWESVGNIFMRYEKQKKAKTKLKDIDYKWCDEFNLFLVRDQYSKNSINNIMSILKASIRRMHKNKLLEYDGAGISCRTEITTAVFTPIEEIKTLLSLDLSNKKGMERVRDIYVCQCFLGLRMSDTMNLITNMKLFLKKIDNKLFFEIKTKKTGEVVVIPASKTVLKIAERRDYDFGKPFSQEYYIREIKQLFRLSGLDRDIVFNRTEGGVMTQKTVRYANIVGTHTARRTFATNAFLAGIEPLCIMKITGHRSFNSFIRYIRCSNTKTAINLSNHDFFQLNL